MIDKKDVTLLIQGKYSEEIINKIDNYVPYFDEIIYSTWNIGFPNKVNDGFKFIVNELPDVTNIYNNSNGFFQCMSTLNGLENVKTKYVLKHRSDEYFSNIDLLLKTFNNKLLSANVMFRRIKDAPYQISDHFFLGETDKLKDTFIRLKNYSLSSDEHSVFFKCSSESLIAMHYIVTFGRYDLKYLVDTYFNKNEKLNEIYSIMKEYFDVINVNDLKPIRVAHNHRGMIYDSWNDVRYNSINKMEDLIL